ncbi:unnamed protein product [Rangifer tarandus platyrhynchus]|uniref:Uncharacterized protein n=1 Tax=Rangifer tarandus platyrhynchus TaxID=3082113 RepID=A0ABN8Z155_RANTA|nr:unnamed protein product [Rangifer tarandus platyrhynchus]
MSRPCPYPHGWRTGSGLLRCPLQRGSQATPRHPSSQRRSQRVQNQHHPGKSSPQTLVSAPWLHFLSTQCGCQSCPLPLTLWPQVKQSGPLRLRDHTAGMDGRGRGGQRSRPGDRKQSSQRVSRPRQGSTDLASPEGGASTRKATPQAWCGPAGQGGKVGGDSHQGLAPANRVDGPQTAVSLKAEQPAALAPGCQLRSSGVRASPARKH